MAQRIERGESIELALAAGGTTRVSARECLDLVHLHAANQLEMAIRNGRDCRHLEPLRRLLCAEAVALLERQRRPARGLAGWLAWWRARRPRRPA